MTRDPYDTDDVLEVNGPETPAALWQRAHMRHALDELIRVTREYRNTRNYFELMRFVARFRQYSPYNAMLIHTQKPGSLYVAGARQWDEKWCRDIKAGARPMVILQPMGPVMFVFDVSDTEPREGAPVLPEEIDRPFNVRSGRIGDEYPQLVVNAKRDGILVYEVDHGSQLAGTIRSCVPSRRFQRVIKKTLPTGEKVFAEVPVRYEIAVNSNLTPEARYVTLAHELAHLYCGHLGTPKANWWPDRTGLSLESREFEAESVAYLVCGRLGISNPSEKYLAGYKGNNDEIPPISVDCVMRSAGLIESMSRSRLALRIDDAS